MTTPVYPDSIPGVSSLAWGSEAQVLVTEGDSGARAYRSTTRVPAAKASVTFRYLEGDFAIFKEFWKTDLIRGHKWFILTLPSAAGYAPHVVRFIQHHTSTVDGYGFRTVSADIYVRERKLRPDTVFTYITSTPYPVAVQEALDATFSILSGVLGQNYGFADDSADALFTVLSGSLRTALKSEESDTDSMDPTFTVLSGTLRDVLKTYDGYLDETTERMDSVFTVLSGILRAALVRNSMQAEATDVNFTILSGTLE